MTLEKGQKLGPYEIEVPAGKGGMGEVYRAKDTRLDRIVAIKVLPSRSALNAEARARFEREAKTISSLNHPHVCTLYDVGHEEGIDFLVMEYLEGEPLDERLKRGKIKTAEAVEIGIQIAGALDAAHRKGLVHRDLKPSNIILTKDGAKLLDFGLAKIRTEAVEGMEDETRATPVTGAGTIVGTLKYMSPEQLEGGEADARSDIFSFGATLYELVTGQGAFSGTSKVSLISSIMRDEPRSISELQPTSPPALDRLIIKCLQKDADARWQSARDLKDELEWIASAGSEAGVAAPVSRRRRFQLRFSWILVAVFAVIAFVLALQRLTLKAYRPQTMRFSIVQQEGVERIDWPQISPDGQYLSYLGFDSSGNAQIWIRPLNSQKAYQLPGIDEAYRSFWSPDSKYLAFFDRTLGQLKKVPISGGHPQVICKAGGSDGSWGRNDIILFDDFEGGNRIGQVSALGGESRLAVAPDTSTGERVCSWPYFLPDGRHFIYTVLSSEASFQEAELLKIGNIENMETKVIGQTESRAIYCDPGYILYEKNGFLVAHAFNLTTLELEGEPIPLSDSISTALNSNRGLNVSASGNGIVVWNKRNESRNDLTWLDRSGEEIGKIGTPGYYRDLRLSADNSRVAYTIGSGGNHYQIGILDLYRKTSSVLTVGEEADILPTWSPDGRSLAYLSIDGLGPSFSLKYKPIGGRKKTLITSDSMVFVPLRWTDSGMLWFCRMPMAFGITANRATKQILTIDISDTVEVDTVFTWDDTSFPFEISPDGRYLLSYTPYGVGMGVFIHDMTGSSLAQPLPIVGSNAHWSPAGDEVFFLNEDGDFMCLEVNVADGIKFGEPKRLFSPRLLPAIDNIPTVWGYDVARDGRKFLFITPSDSGEEGVGEIEVIVDWHAELEESK